MSPAFCEQFLSQRDGWVHLLLSFLQSRNQPFLQRIFVISVMKTVNQTARIAPRRQRQAKPNQTNQPTNQPEAIWLKHVISREIKT
jgi:hypothetical protein